jgi:hypothetical protein
MHKKLAGICGMKRSSSILPDIWLNGSSNFDAKEDRRGSGWVGLDCNPNQEDRRHPPLTLTSCASRGRAMLSAIFLSSSFCFKDISPEGWIDEALGLTVAF